MTSAASSMTVAKRAAALSALALVSIAVLPSVARADGGTPADALFREGRTLLDAKRFDEACPKLAESQKQEPGAGTLLALALCHEGQGKTATAWNELNEAAALGKRVGRNDFAGAAQKRANAMEPLLSRIVVHVPKGEDEYQVKCDGERLDSKQWDTPLVVDPGEHRVDVSAKGKIARSYAVRLTGAGVTEILVDKLDDAPRPAAREARPGAAAPRLDRGDARSRPGEPGRSAAHHRPHDRRPRRRRSRYRRILRWQGPQRVRRRTPRLLAHAVPRAGTGGRRRRERPREVVDAREHRDHRRRHRSDRARYHRLPHGAELARARRSAEHSNDRTLRSVGHADAGHRRRHRRLLKVAR